jgi:hypothetical protein
MEDGKCGTCGQVRERAEVKNCNRCIGRNTGRKNNFKAQGLCAYCGKRPPVNGQFCAICKDARTRKFKDRYESAIAQGLCPHCFKPPVEGGISCAKYLEAKRAYNQKLKDEVFDAYGGYVCACCNEAEPSFLQIDHIMQDGYKLRKEQGQGGQLYAWLRRNKYPDGYQVLCANCNWARARRDNPNGICPHQSGTAHPNHVAQLDREISVAA